MTRRNELHVKTVTILSPLNEQGPRPYTIPRGSFYVDCERDYHDGEKPELVRITFEYDVIKIDGASTFWPVSLLVPQWRPGDDKYNVAPFAHDLLYVKKGRLEGATLSREECDDILRGLWRLWGMSRAMAGVADKAIEWFAGCPSHWGNDGYGITDRVRIKLEVLK